ncbi:undecaprenyl-diphosphate phosphatase [Candidatus Parcubacteria bacterium]|nr:undecaprenyl-diphosphate phosphatase [Candidatus Parcubacteria bacterium]
MWDYIILGVLQGIFEWIPISSEGVVAFASQFLKIQANPVDMALFLHLGTFFAVLIYFRNDWKQVFILKNSKLIQFLIISTFISLIVGFPFYKLVRNMAVGNVLLLIMGFGLLLTSYFHKTKKTLGLDLNKLAVIAGCLQGLAVIPGLSRSGSTIFGLSLGNLSPAQILKLSYMMSAPVILVSTTYLILENSILLNAWPSLIFSFLAGFLSLNFLMKIAQGINFYRFTLIFSLLCFLGALIGFLI